MSITVAQSKPFPVRVIWRDISEHDGPWVELDGLEPDARTIESWSWCVYEDYDYDAGRVSGVTSYPRGCIVSIERAVVRESVL